MNIQNKEVVIDVPTWKVKVKILVSSDEKTLIKWDEDMCKHWDLESDRFNCVARTCDIILNDEGFREVNIAVKSDSFTYGVLSHELLHAVFYILKNSGVRYHDSSEESYTYLLEYLTNSFLYEMGL